MLHCWSTKPPRHSCPAASSATESPPPPPAETPLRDPPPPPPPTTTSAGPWAIVSAGAGVQYARRRCPAWALGTGGVCVGLQSRRGWVGAATGGPSPAPAQACGGCCPAGHMQRVRAPQPHSFGGAAQLQAAMCQNRARGGGGGLGPKSVCTKNGRTRFSLLFVWSGRGGGGPGVTPPPTLRSHSNTWLAAGLPGAWGGEWRPWPKRGTGPRHRAPPSGPWGFSKGGPREQAPMPRSTATEGTRPIPGRGCGRPLPPPKARGEA